MDTFLRNTELKPPGRILQPKPIGFWEATGDLIDYTPEVVMPLVADDYAFSNYLKDAYRDVNWRDYVDPVSPFSRDLWQSGRALETLRSGDGALNEQLGLPPPRVVY